MSFMLPPIPPSGQQGPQQGQPGQQGFPWSQWPGSQGPGPGFGPGPGGPPPGPGFGPGPGGPPPGPGPGGPGFGPGPGGPPPGPGPGGPPPQFIPHQPQASLYAVDPGAIAGCLFRNTYVWLNDGESFWFFPIFVGRTSVAGFRWNGRFWMYFGLDLRRIRTFTCF
jgi:hypothetical protein